MKIKLTVVLSAILLSGCAIDETTPMGAAIYDAQHETAEESGLIAVRPYPNADSICQVLGSNAMTASFFARNTSVVGCPRFENEAIAELEAAGFKNDGSTRSWIIFTR